MKGRIVTTPAATCCRSPTSRRTCPPIPPRPRRSTVDGTATGKIETFRDRDWFAVTLEAGKTYRFDLEGSYTEKGTLSNPELWGIYDENGARIDGAINGGGIGYNKHRYFTADSDGTYYVSAGAEHGPWVGSYTLGVTELAADVAADTGTTATVAVGSPVTGDIETLGDRDWFSK